MDAAARLSVADTARLQGHSSLFVRTAPLAVVPVMSSLFARTAALAAVPVMSSAPSTTVRPTNRQAIPAAPAVPGRDAASSRALHAVAGLCLAVHGGAGRRLAAQAGAGGGLSEDAGTARRLAAHAGAVGRLAAHAGAVGRLAAHTGAGVAATDHAVHGPAAEHAGAARRQLRWHDRSGEAVDARSIRRLGAAHHAEPAGRRLAGAGHAGAVAGRVGRPAEHAVGARDADRVVVQRHERRGAGDVGRDARAAGRGVRDIGVHDGLRVVRDVGVVRSVCLVRRRERRHRRTGQRGAPGGEQPAALHRR